MTTKWLSCQGFTLSENPHAANQQQQKTFEWWATHCFSSVVLETGDISTYF